MSHYTGLMLSDSELIGWINKAKNNPPLLRSVTWVDNPIEDSNLAVKLISSSYGTGTGMQPYVMSSYECKVTPVEGSRCCIIRFPAKIGKDNVWMDGETYDQFLVISTNNNPAYTVTKPSTISNRTVYVYENREQINNTTLSFSTYSLSDYDTTWWNEYKDRVGFVNETDVKSKLDDLLSLYGSYRIQRFNASPSNLGMLSAVGRYNVLCYSYEKLPFPLFEYTDVDAINTYLRTGDDSGAVDPFDPNTPKAHEIENLNSNYRVFITKSEKDPDKTKFSVICYNEELIEYYDVINDDVAMNVNVWGDSLGYTYPYTTKYPTMGFETVIPEGVIGQFPVIKIQLSNLTKNENSKLFSVLMRKDVNNIGNAKITGVSYGIGNPEVCPKSTIPNGYRYTASDGHWLDIVFRTPDMNDLSDPYKDVPDEDSDDTGSDLDYIAGGGLYTFNINDTQFSTINKKLWSTDWTTVFKSNSIDPIKCVISCKSIPFGANSKGVANIKIANLDTGVETNFVNPVKSFDVATYQMPDFNGDFTDVLDTKVRCYLPFIGWVEFPASEVMRIRAYPNLGITGKTKRLKFKYIVDFIDGNCRCVVSVNDTERWYFDGNCAVDVPVTSDGHTQAIANSIRSGVQTVMSVGGAVASYAMGNPVGVVGGAVGAVSSAVNITPTYDFGASCNPSGYINASMSNNIIIVFERPNVQTPTNFARTMGRPCERILNLGSLSGFTRCKNVDVSGINGTPAELDMIKAYLESGVYL